MLLKRAFIVNLGGTAEVDFSRLLSLVGTKVFFCLCLKLLPKKGWCTMIKPSYDEVLNLKDNYSVIPIYKEIYADAFTPINLLRKIAGKSDKFFLLESIEGGEKWARYSFIGFNPKARLSYKNGTLTVTGEGARVVKTAKPYDALREYLADYKTPHFKDIPPFTGGLVGYFGYAMISVAEPVLKLKRGDTNDFDMMLFDKIIAYDHLKEKLIIIVNMKTNDTKGAV